MSSPPVKSKITKAILNPFEQVSELAKDTIKKVPGEVVQTLNPMSEMWGSPTPKPENMPGGPNFNPVDFKKLEKSYAGQDSPDLDKIRAELAGQDGSGSDNSQMSDEQAKAARHKQYQSETEQYYAQKEQEEAEKEKQEEEAKQQQLEEEAAAQQEASQQSTPQGKVRKNILGGGHKKANMELPPEVRSERRGGSGKH